MFLPLTNVATKSIPKLPITALTLVGPRVPTTDIVVGAPCPSEVEDQRHGSAQVKDEEKSWSLRWMDGWLGDWVVGQSQKSQSPPPKCQEPLKFGALLPLGFKKLPNCAN